MLSTVAKRIARIVALESPPVGMSTRRMAARSMASTTVAPVAINSSMMNPPMANPSIMNSAMTVEFPSSIDRPTIRITQMQQSKDSVDSVWSDGHRSTFHYVWLRDNCRNPVCHHPEADERLLDSHSIALDIAPTDIRIDDEKMYLNWPDGHESVYPLGFLKNNCYSSNASGHDKAFHEFLWNVKDITRQQRPQLNYDDVMHTDRGLEAWLEDLRLYGFSLIRDVPNVSGQAETVARRISFLRETFWGDSWSVKSEPNPRNLSLTGVELFPHTDFAWSPNPPGLQFLHCVRFTGPTDGGGESTLVDGFRVAEDLRKLNPQAFRLLSNVQLEHFFSSANESYSHRGSTIQLDDQGRVRSFRYNQANRRPLDVPSELMLPMYEALKEFTNMIRSPEYLLKFRLKEGDMLVFNNHRLLHGRTSYDPQVIGRHLNGCYLDLEQFESKCSIMYRSMTKKRGYQQSMGGQRRNFSTNVGIGPGHQQSMGGQRRGFSTNVGLDPGYDKYDQKFVDEALAPYKDVIESGEEYEDGSSLQKVVHQEHADFKALKDGTKADMVYQCALFGHDWETNAVNRIIGMLKKLEGEHIRLGTGAQVDLFEHSVQCATLAYLDDQDEEMIVMSLLHDIGEMMSPTNHGEIAGAILRPFISPERYWILAHHEIFQGYYYFHHVGGNRNTRDLYKDHEMYQPTVDFCEKYDQAAFDPDYESLPIDFFKPMLKRTFERTPYFWYPNHPKLGVVTIQDDVEEEDVTPVSV